MKKYKKYIKYIPYVILFVSLISSLATLYFSEIMHFLPCKLCWYQRIAMYPIVAISAVGIYLKDKNLPLYLLPLSIAGWLIALYHNLLYYRIIPENLAPCALGVSCLTKYVRVFGFIDIPLGSLMAFTIINVCTIILLIYKGKENK